MQTAENHPPDYALSMRQLLGQRLIVSRSEQEPWLLAYDVLSGEARVGSIRLDDPGAIAKLAAAEGDWCLTKRRRLGWELVIESAEGRHIGWYSGRPWSSGGIVSLTDGTQVELRRSITGMWRLDDTETGRRIADMRISGPASTQKIELTITRFPTRTQQGSVLILASCAVRILYRMITSPAVPVGP